MKNFFDFLIYLAALPGFWIIRCSPRCFMNVLAATGGFFLMWSKGFVRTSDANLQVAFPDMDSKKRRKIIRASGKNFILCLLEYVWASKNQKRLDRCYLINEAEKDKFLSRIANRERVIFVNPHMASWEGASAIVAKYTRDFAGVAVIVKAVKNKYLDKLFNGNVRGNVKGIQVIYSTGALRGTIKAFNEGKSLGILIDQNTKVRDGGAFVNFFGLPAPSSLAPAALAKYCLNKNIPVNVCYSMGVREDDGKIHFYTLPLSKSVTEYESDVEMIQELMDISAREIAKRPEQYLWSYPRFRYIPADASDELAAKYPAYAHRASERFYSAKAYHAKKNAAADNGK